METSQQYELRFVTTAAASADAHALSSPGLVRLDLVVDVLAIFMAGVMIVLGMALVGVVILAVAVFSLVGSVFHPLQRLLISMRFKSLLGKETRVTFDGKGVQVDGELGTAFVPWQSVSHVRANNRTLALFRGRILVGYVPASAFSSPEHQAEVTAFARARAGKAAPVTGEAA